MIQEALAVMADYVEVGAAHRVPLAGTRFLIPWFLVKKPEGEGEKVRFIADCRVLNRFLQPPTFKLDNWKHILPFLKKGMWGAKVDLKHAYFHLHNSSKLLPYMRVNIGPEVYQFTCAVFGLNVLPQLFMAVMKVPQKVWREKGPLVFIYLDDILVLGHSKSQCSKALQTVKQDLSEAGFVLNLKKYSVGPTQTLDHLVFTIDFKNCLLNVPPQTLHNIKRELGKLVTHSTMSPRKIAAILGVVRSFLTAMPFLRAFNNHMLAFIELQSQFSWDSPLRVPPS